MSTLRALPIAMRHVYRLWETGQLRFRVETFGLYYPALPYRSPWWRISPAVLLLLPRRAGAYARWLAEMEAVRRDGPEAWWSRHRGKRGY